jgi:hypothetical protein
MEGESPKVAQSDVSLPCDSMSATGAIVLQKSQIAEQQFFRQKTRQAAIAY